MFDLKSAPVARILLPFSAGAYAGYGATGSITAAASVPWCLGLWVLAGAFYRFSRRGSRPFSFGFACVCFLLFLAAGYGSGKAAWKADPGLVQGKRILVQGVLRETPSHHGEFICFDFHARMVHDGTRARQINTILKVYLRPGGDLPDPVAGEKRMFYGTAYPVRNSGNPGDPDFETIMNRKNVWYRFYASSLPGGGPDLQPGSGIPVLPAEFLPAAFRIRTLITGQWRGGTREMALLQAVCLGERSGLTDDLRQSYSQAGGMHLLAVSGLHVGLIWWVLRHIFSWMTVFPKGTVFRSISVVLLLWFYAFVTGFAPPVCRSVIMFTLITGSRMLDHRTHPVNAILVSAFLLLVKDPGWITQAGFQLSYAAILGIAMLYRPLTGWIRPANRLLAYCWQAMALSFSAQLATAPLVVYYFHQFPVYSLFTSLIAVPLLSCLVALFVISVPFAVTGFLPGILNRVMMELAGGMNLFMEFVASIPGAVVGGLYPDQAIFWFSLALVGIIMSAVSSWRPYKLNLALLVLLALFTYSSGKSYRLCHSSEMVVAHFRTGSMVTFREGVRADHYLHCSDTVTAARMYEYLERHWMKAPLENRLFRLLDSVPARGGITCCRILAPGVRLVGNDRISGLVVSGNRSVPELLWEQWNPDFILLCDGAGSRLPLPGNPAHSHLVIDGSNRRPVAGYPWNVHDTGERGAFIRRW